MDAQLPTNLPTHHDLGHGITCIDVDLQRPGLACCYLLQSGDQYAFVETGTAHTADRLLILLDHLGIARGNVRYVMPTHVHLDHAAGAGGLMQALPNAQLVAHPRAARHLIDPSKLIAGATVVYGEAELRARFGIPLPVAESRVIIADDGHRLDFNGRPLVFLDTPGHARHHYCIWDEASRGFFTGDSFGLSYREFDTVRGASLFPTTTPVQFEPDAWQTTLDRLMAYQPQRMYLTHYGRVEGIETLAQDLRRQLMDYVRIAQALKNAPDRHAAIQEALMQAALRELKNRDVGLPEEKCRELLAMDMDLNSQGLEVWLERKVG